MLCGYRCRLPSRWILNQLLPPEDKAAEDEPDSDRASALRQAQPLETQLLLTGRREIDGPMRSGSGGYPPDYLVEDVRDLSRGQRCAGLERHMLGVKSMCSWALGEVEAAAICIPLDYLVKGVRDHLQNPIQVALDDTLRA